MAISKELTQKVKRTDSDEEDEEDVENMENMEDKEDEKDKILLKNKEGNIKTNSEIDDFIQFCRTYYNKEQEKKRENIEGDGISDDILEKEKACHDEKNTSQASSDMNSKLSSGTSHANTNNTKSKSCSNKKSSSLLANTNDEIRKRKNNKRNKTESSISDVDTGEHNNKKFKSRDINETFDSKSSKKEKSKLYLKVQKIKNRRKANKMKKHEEENEDYSPNLEFENPRKKPILDSPLEETTSREGAQKRNNMTNLKTIANSTIQEPAGISHEAEIDPKKYVNIKPKYLKTQLPDVTTGGDEDSEQEEQTHRIMSEAFADDDVVEEFRKEQEEEVRNQNFK